MSLILIYRKHTPERIRTIFSKEYDPFLVRKTSVMKIPVEICSKIW
jgi:hypothetical protein